MRNWFGPVLVALILLLTHIEALQAEGKEESTASSAKLTYQRTEDVVYGRRFGTALTLDVFQPENPNGAGLIFVVSGGWISFHEAIDMVSFEEVLRRGYTVFAVVHGSQPRYIIPEIVEDIHRSVRFIRMHAKEYQVDPNRLGISGLSAGAHLCLIMATQGGAGNVDAKDPVDRESSAVQAVACFFPPTDFLNYGDTGVDAVGVGALSDFKAAFGPRSDTADGRQIYGREISPIYHIHSKLPPILIIHGDADTLVPIQQSRTFLAKARSVSTAEMKLVTRPGKGHGWPDIEPDLVLLADWFDTHLAGLGAPQAAETAPSDLHVKKSLADGDVLTIRQTWSQEPNGYVRTADVLVPSGEGPLPVVIILHGMGGDSKFAQFICTVTPRFNDVIRVAPNGYLKSWNIDAEPSKAPDVAFMRDLIELIKTYDNVDAERIYLLGFSNGSALVNRLLIELDDAAFQKAGCVVAQMTTKMYHDGSFWYNPTGSNDYDQKITPAPGRKIISINGTADTIVPYLGGDSVVAGTRFLDCQESLYRFAQAMGETGPQIADADGIPGNLNDSDLLNDYAPQFVKYSYLKGQVVHYKLMGGGHGLGVDGNKNFGPEAMKIIADFFFE